MFESAAEAVGAMTVIRDGNGNILIGGPRVYGGSAIVIGANVSTPLVPRGQANNRCEVYNIGFSDIWINENGPAAAAGPSIPIFPGGCYVFLEPPVNDVNFFSTTAGAMAVYRAS